MQIFSGSVMFTIIGNILDKLQLIFGNSEKIWVNIESILIKMNVSNTAWWTKD